MIVTFLLLVTALPAAAASMLEVKFSGLSGEAQDNVKASVELWQQRGDETLTPGRIQQLYEDAPAQVRRALEPFGYYRPTITPDLTEPVQADTPWRASFAIDVGQRVPVEVISISFRGKDSDAADLNDLATQWPLLEGETLDHRRYSEAKRELIAAIRELGFLDAQYVENRIEVDLADYVASIKLVVDTGPRFTFGAVTFVQDQFAPEYLARYLLIENGQSYSQSALARQRSVLSRSGHFQEVVIETDPPQEGSPQAIPLRIRLEPNKANRYRGRVGWGSDTDFGVQADWTRRYIGRQGHRFNLGGTLVQDRDRIASDLNYTIPLNPLTGSAIELGARHESKDLTYQDVELDEGGDTRIATNILSLAWVAPEFNWLDFELQRSMSLGLVGETYDVFEVLFGHLPQSSQQVIIDNIGRKAYDTLAPDFEAIVADVTLILRRANDPLFISRGDYLKLQLLGADESLGSNISFWQARVNTWNIFPVGERGRFLTRTALGYTDAESRDVLSVNFNQMPEYFEFRAGGARSVRGYQFETLFPDDAITGGKHQIVGSVEYEHEIIPDWSAAVFLDAGDAFNDYSNFDEKLGAGIGVRWRSPVGVARVDLGFPLDDAHESFQVYITVGPEF
ncbi:MAG: BamA/TamA family outer membrane protein [Halioglobus sp.]